MWSAESADAPHSKADLVFCKRLQIHFTDEWAETIQSNDWQYWDDLFAE